MKNIFVKLVIVIILETTFAVLKAWFIMLAKVEMYESEQLACRWIVEVSVSTSHLCLCIINGWRPPNN